MKVSILDKPKIVGESHEGEIVQFIPSTHMAIEHEGIMIAIPLGKSQRKTKIILDKAIDLIQKELINFNEAK